MSAVKESRRMIFQRVIMIVTFSTLFGSLACFAIAEARTRCVISSPKLSSLSKRLTYAESPKAWRRIYQETSTALSIIEPQYDQLRDIDHDARRRLVAFSEDLCCTWGNRP